MFYHLLWSERIDLCNLVQTMITAEWIENRAVTDSKVRMHAKNLEEETESRKRVQSKKMWNMCHSKPGMNLKANCSLRYKFQRKRFLGNRKRNVGNTALS